MLLLFIKQLSREKQAFSKCPLSGFLLGIRIPLKRNLFRFLWTKKYFLPGEAMLAQVQPHLFAGSSVPQMIQ